MYGTNAMVPTEVGEISLRQQNFIEVENNEALQEDLDLVEQVRENTIIIVKACKQYMAWRFN